MNIKTRIEKTVFMDLRMEEEEARQLARDIKSGKWGSCKILNKLLCAIPVMEGESDEKITDDEPDLSFDDLLFRFDGPDADLSVGPAADGADARGCGCGPNTTDTQFPGDPTETILPKLNEIMEKRSAIHDATMGTPGKPADAADTQSDLADPSPAALLRTANAINRSTNPGTLRSCGCKSPMAESKLEFPQRSVKPK